MSDTPRTDEAEYECVDEPVVKLGSVDAEFARQLERELNAANEQIKRMKSVGDELLEWIDDNSVSGSNRKLLANAWQRAKEAKP